MRRVFAAVRPPQEAVEHLVAALRPVRAEFGRELRWTDPETWHLTMAFYGDQPNDVSDLADFLAGAAAMSAPMRLHLRGAGAFNSRTLWIGVGGDVRDLRELMADCLLDPEERHRQRAHLTVARAIPRSEWALREVAHALSVYAGPEFRVDQLHLIESRLGEGRGGGPRYETLETFRLG